MGLRGPPPQATNIRVIRGNPGKRPLNKREPKREALSAETMIARRPEHLSEAAARWWDYYAEMFAPSCIIVETDLPLLEQLACTTAARVDYQRKLDMAGPLAKSGSGVPVISPLHRLIESVSKHEYKLLREFGGSPSSRSTVQMVSESTDANPWAELA